MTARNVTSNESVAWFVDDFPTVSGTSVLREMDELERYGVDIELFALARNEPDVLHASAAARLADMTAGTDCGFGGLVASQFRWMGRRFGRLTKLWAKTVFRSRGSLRLRFRALVVVAKAAFLAEELRKRGVVARIHAVGAGEAALAAYAINLLTDLPYSVAADAQDVQVGASMLAEKLSGSDQVIARSTIDRQKLVDSIPELADRCAVVRRGVPRSSVVAVAPVLDHSDGAAIELCCVGSLEPYKGHRHLLGACHRLIERGNDVRCTIAGSGPELGALEVVAKELGIGERVRFVGALDGPSVARLLADSDVFVLPSNLERSGRTEGIPVAMMEAMAAGTSVVASRLSGIPELVAHEVSGLLVEPGDEEALALAVERIVANPERAAAMASAALGRIEAEFTVERNAARLAGLLGLKITVPEVRLTLDQGRLVDAVVPPPPELSRN